MCAKRYLTEKQKIFIISSFKTMSFGRMSEVLNLPRSTVSTFYYKVKRTNKIANNWSKGRPKKYCDNRSKKRIFSLINKFPKITLKESIIRLRFEISRQTFRKRLKELSINNYCQPPKVKLRGTDKTQRLIFCRDNLQKNYKRIVFLDEVSVEHVNSYRTRVWRKFGVIDPEKHYKATTKTFIKKYIKFVSLITYDGTRHIERIETWNSQTFIRFLERILDEYNFRNKILLLDLDSVHNSGLTRRFIQSKGINVIYTPPRSPDLNCIENCFYILKKNLSKSPIPKTNEELSRLVISTFHGIESRIINSLCKSFRRRIIAVQENSGGNTKY